MRGAHGMVIGIDVAGAADAICPAISCWPVAGSKFTHWSFDFRERSVDFIVNAEVERKFAGDAPFVPNEEVQLIGVKRGRAGKKYVAADGDRIAEQHGGDRFAGSAGRGRIARIGGIENPASETRFLREGWPFRRWSGSENRYRI